MTSVTDADRKLWANYGTQLMNHVMGASQLGPDDRFYLAPLTAAGIAAGKRISEDIKNQGVYQIADTLLELNTPVFMPTRKSFFDRAMLYVNSVELLSDLNPGAVSRYDSAQDDAKAKQKEYNDAYKEAHKAWLQAITDKEIEGTDSFDTYWQQFYPNLAQLSQTASGAAAKASAAAAQVNGPNAPQVSKYLINMSLAAGKGEQAGYTMKCSPQSATQVASKQTGNDAGSYYSPRYDISTQYSDDVDGWIAVYPQKTRDKDFVTINISAKNSESSNFTKLGFEETKVSVTGSYALFFKATYTYENKTVTKEISAAEAGSELEMTLTATSMGSYKVNPGQKWNPASLFSMPLVENADPSLRTQVAYVNQVVLGYGVGINFKMSSSLQTTISDHLEKASKHGGSASFFGYNIGLGPSVDVANSSTVNFDDVKNASTGGGLTLPASDNAYPTLLAVIGTTLPTPPARK